MTTKLSIPPQVEQVGSNFVFRFDFAEASSADENESQQMQQQYLEVSVSMFQWSYDALVSAIVRAKYSQSDVEAIQLNADASKLYELELWRDHAKDLAARQFQLDKTLEGAKAIKLRELKYFDKSESVNCFFLNGSSMWITLDKRKDLRQSLIALQASGVEEFTYWNDATPITMPVSQFESILNSIEVYALTCYNVTAQHKANISALASIEEVLNYDFKQGYPDKLHF